MRVLVTGGAGYIGSHTARFLRERGHEVVILDDLSTGHVPATAGFPLRHVDLVRDRLTPVIEEAAPDAVIHFAGKALVPESVRDPLAYYRTNVTGGLRLVRAMTATGVRRLVFSSTCATYGVPERIPIDEGCPQAPISPYGRSKLAFEHVLADACAAYGLGATALRYFNAAGAEADGSHGEDHDPETHLVPCLLTAVRDGGTFRIYGTDYATPDGTCIRDYIHLDDLAEAHLLAVEAIEPGRFTALNLGTGRGCSVREVVDAARRITGREVRVEEAPRRPGDPPELVAAVGRAREVLGFEAKADLEAILRSAWAWHRSHPRGYATKAPHALRFGEIALRLGLLTRAQLEEGLEAQAARRERGEPHMLIGLVLLQLGHLDNAQLIEVLRSFEGRAAGAPPDVRLTSG